MVDYSEWKKYSPVILRIGIALVFLWFGISQLTDPASWTSYVPLAVSQIVHPAIVVFINGVFEIICGLLLISGLFTRVAAILLGLHLIGIIVGVGYNEIGVRDFGLMLAAFAIALSGPDTWCIRKSEW